MTHLVAPLDICASPDWQIIALGPARRAELRQEGMLIFIPVSLLIWLLARTGRN